MKKHNPRKTYLLTPIQLCSWLWTSAALVLNHKYLLLKEETALKKDGWMLPVYWRTCDILKQASRVTFMLDIKGQENKILWNQVYCSYNIGYLQLWHWLFETSEEICLFQSYYWEIKTKWFFCCPKEVPLLSFVEHRILHPFWPLSAYLQGPIFTNNHFSASIQSSWIPGLTCLWREHWSSITACCVNEWCLPPTSWTEVRRLSTCLNVNVIV